MRALGSIVALVAIVDGGLHAGGLGACRSTAHATEDRRAAAANNEVWLSDDEIRKLQVSTEEVRLQEVDETIMTVGPVSEGSDCPLAPAPGERKSCVVVAVDQGALGRIRVGSVATARTSALVHDVFAGRVAWIAGALDSAGRTARIACSFDDPIAELRPGRQVRVEIVVGSRPAFAVSRSAIFEARGASFVFTSAGMTDDGRHRFARVPVRPDGDTGGPWIPVADLQPGSLVVKSGAKALASMLAPTSL